MSRAALLACLPAAAALAGAGWWFWTAETTPFPPVLPTPMAQAGPTVAEPPEPRIWPPVFGQLQPPAPAEPAPEPPAKTEAQAGPPTPPLSTLGYALKGTLQSGDDRWALLSHPAGERILKVGDELEPGITAAAIDQGGIWFVTGNGRERLEFQDSENLP